MRLAYPSFPERRVSLRIVLLLFFLPAAYSLNNSYSVLLWLMMEAGLLPSYLQDKYVPKAMYLYPSMTALLHASRTAFNPPCRLLAVDRGRVLRAAACQDLHSSRQTPSIRCCGRPRRAPFPCSRSSNLQQEQVRKAAIAWCVA